MREDFHHIFSVLRKRNSKAAYRHYSDDKLGGTVDDDHVCAPRESMRKRKGASRFSHKNYLALFRQKKLKRYLNSRIGCSWHQTQWELAQMARRSVSVSIALKQLTNWTVCSQWHFNSEGERETISPLLGLTLLSRSVYDYFVDENGVLQRVA